MIHILSIFYSVECGTGHVSRGVKCNDAPVYIADDENGTALIKLVAEKQMGVTADCCSSACDGGSSMVTALLGNFSTSWSI